jgi:bacterioferritin-associated ferredoxin
MVTRCVCHAITFAELHALAQRIGPDLPALARLTGCGTSCGLCVPYIRLMLETGRTRLPILPPSPCRDAPSDRPPT